VRPVQLQSEQWAVTVGDAIVVDGVPDPELIQKQVFTEVAFAAAACNLLRAASVAGGMPRFPQGRWQRRAVGRHYHFQTDFAFLPV
jgi:hypothetical protein